MSGPFGAPCTIEVKKVARQQWEARNHHDHLVLGFTADETQRSDRFIKTERSNVLTVLIDCGFTKADCMAILQRAGLTLPRIYSLGYPNANCIGCVKASSPTYWNLVRKMHPEIFWQRALQARMLNPRSTYGAKLVRYKGERIFLDQLPADATGRPMKQLVMPDCGIFCEEKPEPSEDDAG
jgi:hypothetical protein